MRLKDSRTLLTALFLAVAALLACPVAFAQQPGAVGEDPEEEWVRNPEDPITVDFIKKDIHHVFHYIARVSGLNINVEGELDRVLTVFFKDIKPIDAIRSICESNELFFVDSASIITVKDRKQQSSLANVIEGSEPGKYTVRFENQGVIEAIMEVGRITGTQVSVPMLPPKTEFKIETPEGGNAMPGENVKKIAESLNQKLAERLINLYMIDQTPEIILQRIADLGDLVVEDDKSLGWLFRPRQNRVTDAPGIISSGPLVRKTWIIRGQKMADLEKQLKNMISPQGSIVYDEITSLIMVIDTEDRMEDIEAFLDQVAELTQIQIESPDQQADPYEVHTFNIMRDVADQTFLASVPQILTKDGKFWTNPSNNTVSVYDKRSQIDAISKFMTSSNIRPDQVMVTSKLIEITLDDYLGYGLQLLTSTPADNLADGTITVDSTNSNGTVGGLFGQPAGFSPFTAIFENASILEFRLEALAHEGKVKTLTSPSQMVSNRETATIKVSQEVPYLKGQSSGLVTSQATIEYKEIAISMDITPTIFVEEGIIRLDLTIKVQEIIGSTNINDYATPIISNRSTDTNLFIRDGQTLVLGGLIREHQRTRENGIPFLKDIPLLGYLFKTTNVANERTDLLFFLRPQIASATLNPSISGTTIAIQRETRPVVLDSEHAKEAGLKTGNYDNTKPKVKPKHYDPKKRPKTAKDVDPAA